jgi:hypothetical protein
MPDYHRVTLLIPQCEGDAPPDEWAYGHLLRIPEPHDVVVEAVTPVEDRDAAEALFYAGHVEAAHQAHEERAGELGGTLAAAKRNYAENAERELVEALGITWAERLQQMGSYGTSGGTAADRRAFAQKMSETEAALSAFEPEFAPWRHGGWYVTNVHYPSGAVGCVSRNYPDGKWRIACDHPHDETFPTRDAAARAEYGKTLQMAAESERDSPSGVRA